MSYLLPSAARGEDFRRTMDASLLQSSLTLLEEIRPGFRQTAFVGDEAWGDARALDYGAYFDLALLEPSKNQDTDAFRAEAADYLVSRLSRLNEAFPDKAAPCESGISVTTISDAFYSPVQVRRLIRWWDLELENSLGLHPVSDEEFSQARECIASAVGWLERCDPELHGEFTAIIREIVVARPDLDRRSPFGAASSFALWGSMVIDCTFNDSWPRMFRTMAHETAHNLLFAIARNEPLVHNDPDERFPSPLREDLRPVDGIFHGAFVSARESLVQERLLCWHEETGALNEADEALVLELLEISVANFWACVDALQGVASLTELGSAILTDCEQFMRENFALEDA